jgi:hypothetical protein
VKSLVVNGGGGTDSASLADSAFDDSLKAAGNVTDFSNTKGLDTTLAAFASVTASSNHGGHDTKTIQALDFILQAQGDWLAS